MNNQIAGVVEKVTRNRRFKWVLTGLILLAVLLGVIIVPVEMRNGRGGNINNLEDGMWWAVTTISGVGYGDTYPVTSTGRLIGAVLEIFGVILFGSVVAIVAVELLRYQEDYYARRMFKRMDELEIKMDEMKKQLDFLVKK